ncbi:hypothetical protein OUZ56_013038 [Daphnia magna]|uniref:Uncharacterized protein n=1 Tax=Daphnia magna TaxID=35525 RepID=A0ABQ9Z4R8_9CRUS|nr:hypothetical protein OUZ56_013038 [Daphnia magna]
MEDARKKGLKEDDDDFNVITSDDMLQVDGQSIHHICLDMRNIRTINVTKTMWSSARVKCVVYLKHPVTDYPLNCFSNGNGWPTKSSPDRITILISSKIAAYHLDL